eukprot:2219525-Rhodomonas_salina.1
MKAGTQRPEKLKSGATKKLLMHQKRLIRHQKSSQTWVLAYIRLKIDGNGNAGSQETCSGHRGRGNAGERKDGRNLKSWVRTHQRCNFPSTSYTIWVLHVNRRVRAQ